MRHLPPAPNKLGRHSQVCRLLTHSDPTVPAHWTAPGAAPRLLPYGRASLQPCLGTPCHSGMAIAGFIIGKCRETFASAKVSRELPDTTLTFPTT